MRTSGLEGVVAAETRLSMVDGEAGELLIAGYPVAQLAPNAAFEETAWLLLRGSLPDPSQLATFAAALAGSRPLSPQTLTLLEACAARGLDPMDALRIAAGTVSLDPIHSTLPGVPDDALALMARFPAIVGAFHRLRSGRRPLPPRSNLGHAANFLFMLTGEEPDSERVRAMETYFNTVVDHGLNASTFTARVITSTGSDLVSAIVGAVGALKGPLHGGAPGPALDMVFEIGTASRAEQVLRRKIESGEKLMGFGHRVYRVRDPRADVLAAAAERLFAGSGDRGLYELAMEVESVALRLLEEYKPGRRLRTNVEFSTALLLHGIGLDTSLFTPAFAVSRVVGWIAHALEQRAAGRLIRPQSEYIGPRGLAYEPSSLRSREILT